MAGRISASPLALVLCRVAVVCVLLLPSSAPAQTGTKRLILKDGSYQVTTKWEIKGDRVHYFSAERSEWEDVPNSLVDWDATKKYETERAAGKTAQEASSGSCPVRAARMRSTSSRSAVICNSNDPSRSSTPFASGATDVTWENDALPGDMAESDCVKAWHGARAIPKMAQNTQALERTDDICFSEGDQSRMWTFVVSLARAVPAWAALTLRHRHPRCRR